MRQLKVIVMMVGVALSATPIFNSANAQQNSGQANLMLEVQSLRQEIAQLRDMVERQQYEMRKLNREHLEMQKAADAQSVPELGTPNSYPDGSNYQGAAEYREPSADYEAASEQASNYSVADNSAPQRYPNEGNRSISVVSANGTIIEERVITATPKESVQNAQGGSVPVVDRSFSQAVRNVPVTGKGAAGGDLPMGAPIVGKQVINQAESALSASELGAASETARQVASNSAASANGGVITIAQGASREWRTGVAAKANNTVDAAIVANTAPADPNVGRQVEAAQSVIAATDSSADSAPTLSEDDYYGQGFELLKQSKYEEASTIFERQIKAYPRGNLADDAHYWIAEAMHVSRKLDVSKQHLRTIINDYPQSPRLPDAMLKTAYIEQSQGNKIEAQILFQEIVNLHPKSDAAIAAKNQLSKAN